MFRLIALLLVKIQDGAQCFLPCHEFKEAAPSELLIPVFEHIELFDFPEDRKYSHNFFVGELLIDMRHVQFALFAALQVNDAQSFQLPISIAHLQPLRNIIVTFLFWQTVLTWFVLF